MVIHAPIKVSHSHGSGGGKIQLAGSARFFYDRQHAACHIGNQIADVEQTADDHNHLYEIQNGNGHHAAKRGVSQDDGGTQYHAVFHTHRAIGNHFALNCASPAAINLE